MQLIETAAHDRRHLLDKCCFVVVIISAAIGKITQTKTKIKFRNNIGKLKQKYFIMKWTFCHTEVF